MSRDFFGFSFNGVHSKDLNIVRVSNGDRYNSNLLPELEDKTVDIPGNDGEYYFGSYYNKKEFSINFAFDSVTEENFRELRRLFSTKDLVPLVFDERPYVTYFVKVQSSPDFNFVCFDEEDLTKGEKTVTIKKSREFPVLYREEVIVLTDDENKDGELVPEGEGKIYRLEKEYDTTKRSNKRVYKGEGTLSLIAYNPFGICINKTLKDYKDPETEKPIENCENIDEWANSSKLLENLNPIINKEVFPVDTYIYNENGGYINVYNPSDIPTPPLIYIKFNDSGVINSSGIGVAESENTRRMIWGEISKKGIDEGVVINCQNHLIEGVVRLDSGTSATKWEEDEYGKKRLVSFTTSGNIYNEHIIAGDFFKIPYTREKGIVSEEDEKISKNDFLILNFNGLPRSPQTGEETVEEGTIGIMYDYYYI